MKRHILLLPALLFAAGCSSTEPLEERIRELTWTLNASEKAAEQLAVDKGLAAKEVDLARRENAVLKEKLAVAYDAVRDARAKLDEGLADRITQLSEADPHNKLSISQYGGVVLDSGILFTPGKHELSTSGQAALTPLVSKLLEAEYAAYDIELAGHTDSDPIKHSRTRYRDNWDLGSMRANSVRRFLIERGIAAERIYLASWGPTRPIDSSSKKKNRRVEIVLHPKETDGSVPASASRD